MSNTTKAETQADTFQFPSNWDEHHQEMQRSGSQSSIHRASVSPAESEERKAGPVTIIPTIPSLQISSSLRPPPSKASTTKPATAGSNFRKRNLTITIPKKTSTPRGNTIKSKIALFDQYAPSMTAGPLKNQDLLSIATPIRKPSSASASFLRRAVQKTNSENEKPPPSKGGGFAVPTSAENFPNLPLCRTEQIVHNQPFISVVEPSAKIDILPKSVQSPFTRDSGALTRMSIPQLPLDTLDMLESDAFGNSLNSVRVNWTKNDEDVNRSVTVTSRVDRILTRPLGSRVVSANSGGRRYSIKPDDSIMSLPNSARARRRQSVVETFHFEHEDDDEDITKMSHDEIQELEDGINKVFKRTNIEEVILDSLRTSVFLNTKEEKDKRGGMEYISIDEHVKACNDSIHKISVGFRDKLKKIHQTIRKEIGKVIKYFKNEINGFKEEKSDNIVNSFMKDKILRKKLESLKQELAELKKRYAEARETVDEMSVYREKYELSKRQIDKLVNERPAKSAENTITKLMAGKFDLSTKEKQDLLQDFLKMFYNEDGSLNEGALFDMFLVNKKLHENLSKTRDTVSYLRDQLYEAQKKNNLLSPNSAKNQPVFDFSLLKSQQEKQQTSGIGQAQVKIEEPTMAEGSVQVIYELRSRNEYLRRCYDMLVQKVQYADTIAVKIKQMYNGVDKFTKCSLCKENTLKPKILRCGHAFCQKCSSSDKIKRLDETTNSFIYVCTQCREESDELIDNKNLNELLSFTNELDIELGQLGTNIQDAISFGAKYELKSGGVGNMGRTSPRPSKMLPTVGD